MRRPLRSKVLSCGEKAFARRAQSATSVDAQLFGIFDRTGSIEAGKLADIVAVPGNPLAEIRQTEKVFFVMKDGVVYRNDRRQ